MKLEHEALIVEDEKPISDALEEMVRAAGCRPTVAANVAEAVAALDAKRFCIVLLDLKIKASSDALLSDESHGRSILNLIRERYQEHAGSCYWLTVLIVSGFAGEYDVAHDIMRHGAHRIIRKPFKSHEVVSAIQEALVESGRSSHTQCATPPVPRPVVAGSEILVEIPGDFVDRRARVLVAQREVLLAPRHLELLLRLLTGHARGTLVHKSELGSKGDDGFRLPGELSEQVASAIGKHVKFITNDGHGSYGLAAQVKLGACNLAAFLTMSERAIGTAAKALAEALTKPPG